jgi:hypothetical protein
MQREKWVSFREDQKVIDAMQKMAEDQGIDRSGFIRQTIREKLRSVSGAERK